MACVLYGNFTELTVAWQAVISFGFLADPQENHIRPYGILKAAAKEI